jgi:hypothetical protein
MSVHFLTQIMATTVICAGLCQKHLMNALRYCLLIEVVMSLGHFWEKKTLISETPDEKFRKQLSKYFIVKN